MTEATLYTSMTSPFGRKARIGTILCGLTDKVKIEPVDMANLPPALVEQNPLAKVPVLVDAKGNALFDSRVVLEWMDLQAGGGVILPKDADDRLSTLRLQALADGIGDAWLLQLYERRFRSEEMRSDAWLERQRGKVHRGLVLAATLAPQPSGRPQVGEIALACMLGFGDSHNAGEWRNDHPALVDWLESFSGQVPAWKETHIAPVAQ